MTRSGYKANKLRSVPAKLGPSPLVKNKRGKKEIEERPGKNVKMLSTVCVAIDYDCVDAWVTLIVTFDFSRAPLSRDELPVNDHKALPV